VFLRKALTSGAGTVGWIRGAAAGTGATYTFTPAAANLAAYGFEFSFRGEHYSSHIDTDGTITVAVAIDQLLAQLPSIDGLTITDETTTLQIVCDEAEDLDYARNVVSVADAGTASITVANSVAADIDTIDVSSMVEVVEVLSGLGLALCHVNI
jgi:hypothetical protein